MIFKNSFLFFVILFITLVHNLIIYKFLIKNDKLVHFDSVEVTKHEKSIFEPWYITITIKLGFSHHGYNKFIAQAKQILIVRFPAADFDIIRKASQAKRKFKLKYRVWIELLN